MTRSNGKQPQQGLLEARDLQVDFDTRSGVATVINGLSFSVERGATLGVVGESGCGKSMTALAVMGLVPSPPGRITGGKILFEGEDLLAMPQSRMRHIRGNRISMVFQEPMSALNPVFTIGEQIAEALRLHRQLGRRAAMEAAIDSLHAVGIPAPRQRVNEYPHQLSGGMRQRVMIAMALACEPALLIADEPTTALDVTVQAQIFDLLRSIQEERGTAIILITHDMGVIAEMAQRVIVMYAGRQVETGPVADILDAPAHPYTRGLMSCVPHLREEPAPVRSLLPEIPGMVPSLSEVDSGCPFRPRCSQAMARCSDMPPLARIAPGHSAACWLNEEAVADERQVS